MKHNVSSHRFSETDWQRLGELEVHAYSDIERAIQEWLNQTLHPLGLHSDLLDRILRSAYDATTRALHLKDDGMGFRHVHLFAFSSHNREATRQSWGFFRLEKLEDAADPQRSTDHSIELYLYCENPSDLE